MVRTILSLLTAQIHLSWYGNRELVASTVAFSFDVIRHNVRVLVLGFCSVYTPQDNRKASCIYSFVETI